MIRLIDFPEVLEHEVSTVLKHNRSLTLSAVIFFVYPLAQHLPRSSWLPSLTLLFNLKYVFDI